MTRTLRRFLSSTAVRLRPVTSGVLAGMLLGWSALPVAAGEGQSCQRSSGEQPLAVVELYTSEGCSSCPPAERWLSGLKPADGVLALAFHVSYWDHLGWLDRFATAETTARQHRLKAALGAAYVYTPQVLVNGRDERGWRALSARSLPRLPAASAPALSLSREGEVVTARVAASSAQQTLTGYWVVLSDGLRSAVTRGENAGKHLRHDHLVSHYQPVAPWSARQAQVLPLRWPQVAGQRVAFVVTDRSGARPVQALDLACP